MIDVLIAGGGPAGLATALFAARAGLAPVVIEPRASPIDKACGEGLMPGAVAALAQLLTSPDHQSVHLPLCGVPLRGIRYLSAVKDLGFAAPAVAEAQFAEAQFAEAQFAEAQFAEAQFAEALLAGGNFEPATSANSTAVPVGWGMGVRRTELQTALHRAVIAAGIPIVAGKVTDFSQTDRSVRAAGLTARYLVAADGLHSPIRRALGISRAPQDRGRVEAELSKRHRGFRPRYGVRRHFAVAPWTDLVEVYWSADTEAYVTPVAPDQVGVALLTHRRGNFDDRLREFPQLHQRLVGHAVTEARGAGPLQQTSQRRVAGRVLLVGDAAGYVDALTGEGIAVALHGAAALIDCLARDRPQAYERRWLQVSRRYRLLTAALLWTAQRPTLRRQLVPAAARLPAVFGAIVRQLGK